MKQNKDMRILRHDIPRLEQYCVEILNKESN